MSRSFNFGDYVENGITCPITGHKCVGRYCASSEQVWTGADLAHDCDGTHITADHYRWVCNADGACDKVTMPVDEGIVAIG